MDLVKSFSPVTSQRKTAKNIIHFIKHVCEIKPFFDINFFVLEQISSVFMRNRLLWANRIGQKRVNIERNPMYIRNGVFAQFYFFDFYTAHVYFRKQTLRRI